MKQETYFYMICPKCYQQDCLPKDTFEKLVLQPRPECGEMEGAYTCPYGCKTRMNLFALGDYERVNEKSDELRDKYEKEQL